MFSSRGIFILRKSLLKGSILKKFINVPTFNFAKSIDGLKNILKSEIAHEEQNYSPVDKNELKQFFNNTKFQFIDKENSLNMELKKKEGPYEVVVNFQAKPPLPSEGEQGQEGGEKMPENMTEFVVRVISKDGTGLFVEASTMDTSYEFNSVQYSDNVNQLYENYTNQKLIDNYTGPSFDTLDERLQSEFTDFFNSLGINEELMSFMNVLSVDKDQRLYSKWLKDVNNFFSH
jgi:hypothetical protein